MPYPDVLDRLVAVLDEPSEAWLSARVSAATETLGVAVPSGQMIRVFGLARGDRVRDVVVTPDPADPDRATASIEVAWGVPEDRGGPGLAPKPLALAMVREGARGWRISLWPQGAAGQGTTPAAHGSP